MFASSSYAPHPSTRKDTDWQKHVTGMVGERSKLCSQVPMYMPVLVNITLSILKKLG